MNSFKIMTLTIMLTWSAVAFPAPTLQSDANYFKNIQEDLAWLDAMEIKLPGSDKRTLFLRIYKSVTLEMINMFHENQFNHPEWVTKLMLKYVSLYKDALECDLSKKCPISKAWQFAFEKNKSKKMTPGGQLLISISAHVNRDLPLALASIPSTNFKDETFKEDFRTISTIFERRMPEMIDIVREYESCNVSSLDERVILKVIKWAIGRTREKSWNFGERLSHVKTINEESRMMDSIEKHTGVENIFIMIFGPAPAFVICL